MDSRSIKDVEANMKLRRSIIQQQLGPKCSFVTTTVCPIPFKSTIGLVGDESSDALIDHFISPQPRYRALLRNIRFQQNRDVDVLVSVCPNKNTQSSLEAISNGVRVQDQHTGNDPSSSKISIPLNPIACLPHVNSLQVTMQLQNLSEARKLHDQMIPLAPIMLALTAATTIWNGILADTDIRWNYMSACLDDRTMEEIGGTSTNNKQDAKVRPRLSSNALYVSEDPRLLDQYHNTPIVIDEETKQQLLNSGMHHRLATYYASIFARDPLVVWSEDVEPDSPEDSTALFEAFQGTNYPCVRLKSPPSRHSDTGWRVEFRPMEVQLTDFENAAFAIFIMLLSRTILHFDLNLYMPISMVDMNMERAHERDAVNRQRFYFPANPLLGSKLLEPGLEKDCSEVSSTSSHNGVASNHEHRPGSVDTFEPEGSSSGSSSSTTSPSRSVPSSIDAATDQDPGTIKPRKRVHSTELKANTYPQKPFRHCNSANDPDTDINSDINTDPEIIPTTIPSSFFPLYSISTLINGPSPSPTNPNHTPTFPGFIPLIKTYLDSTSTLDTPARALIERYLCFIADRADGRSWTAAKWHREFVRGHAEYEGDGVVGERVIGDLLRAVRGMGGV